MTEVVRVGVPGSAYDVFVDHGILDQVGELCERVLTGKRVALITDDVVAGVYGMAVSVSLTSAGFQVSEFTVPAGETTKNWHTAGEILEALASAGLGRDDAVVALGGGVIGDLAGFVAATYLRGIDFVQVPTTLLAMVDSSIGGKTGVDLAAGKNLAGAFKQPKMVIADTAVLATLPEREWASGMAEVAKSAIIDGDEFMSWLEAYADVLVERDADTVAEAVSQCVRFKAGVVARDEQEEGLRECLNYGHTLGHAIEKVAGYGEIAHGAAVAEGIRFAARVAIQVVGADKAFAKRQERLLDMLGLMPLDRVLPPYEILTAMRSDKKSREGQVRFVLASEPGVWECVPVPDEVIEAHVNAWAEKKAKESAS